MSDPTPLLASGVVRAVSELAFAVPRRILAECEAKRAVVEIAQSIGGHCEPDAARIAPGILRALALPYADHDDYDESWRP